MRAPARLFHLWTALTSVLFAASCVTTVVRQPEPQEPRPATPPEPTDCRKAMHYKLEALELADPSDALDPDPNEEIERQAKELGLDDEALCAVSQALGGIADPCKPSTTLLDALTSSPRLCQSAKILGHRAVELAREGHSGRVILREIYRMAARETQARAKFVFDDTPWVGSPRSSLRIVEFVDFACTICRESGPKLKQLAKEYGAVLYIKHYPQPFTHPGTDRAALAAIAAQRQGLFWVVYDGLFALRSLDDNSIDGVCHKAGLNMERYRSDMKAPATEKLLARDLREAEAFGVHGTPALFLNGRRLSNVVELERRLRAEATEHQGGSRQ